MSTPTLLNYLLPPVLLLAGVAAAVLSVCLAAAGRSPLLRSEVAALIRERLGL